MASDKEVAAALKRLLDYYTPKDMSKDKLNVYRQQLQRLDGGVLADAVSRCLETMTWMPKLNELFAIANELPVKAKAPNLLRARAFELETIYWHDGVFIAEEWLRLADSMRRAHMTTSSQRIIERMEACSCLNVDCQTV